MAWSFVGNINGTVYSLPQNLPMLIEGFTLVPKASGVTNVYKITLASQQINIMPLNLTVSAGEMYEGTNNVVLLATEVLKVQSSVSVDYDFTISNLEP